MKAFVSSIIALVTFFMSTMGIGVKNPDTPKISAEDFVPVLRFAAYSDTHVKDDDTESVKRVALAVDFANRVAASDESYNKLDAVMFCGDITNSGTVNQFERFEEAAKRNLKDETQLITIVAGNHDGKTLGKESLEYCEKISGLDSDFHIVIGGYHFIGLSSYIKGLNYRPSQVVWLRQQLNKAVLDDPEKPIFVTTHEHVFGTVYGSSLYEGWGKIDFCSVLDDYPQVVHFSGHSHYPVNDPRSIWQGAFTAIGTGTLAYAELTVDADRHVNPEHCGDATQGWIVELDKDNRIRFSGYDITSGTLLCQYLVNDPDNRASFEYTTEKVKAQSSAPAFDDGAELMAEGTDGKYTVTAPAAKSTDGKIIFAYRVFVYGKTGTLLKSDVQANEYYLVDEPETVSFDIEAKSGYTVKVTAENAYGMRSQPISVVIG